MATKAMRFLMAGALILSLAGQAFAQNKVSLRSADTHPEDYPTVQAVKAMAKTLEEQSKGRITMKVFPGRQLGEEKDTIEQTIAGAIDVNRVNMAPLNSVAPPTAIPGLPFIFRSVEHMHKVMDGPIGDQILDSLEPYGLIGLCFYDSGARSFYNSKKPINTPEDMKGMKIRVQNSDLFVSMVAALGANATPMEFGQVYEALSTGVIDGAENNWPSYESTRHFEVAKFYSLDEHSMSPEVLVVSKVTWNKLSKEDQALLRKAARESVPVMRKLWAEREDKARKVVEAAGSKINTVNKEPFIKAMAPLYDKFANTPQLKDLVTKIQAVQ
ncbi:Solute-binding protein [Fundidesulfovibrio magnetotacticus]|uniref:Solute-binding protein n=1 Tax=Fundidesulfovibrio magnetotacticus TaxID=2730080 RepID=A0A6V8LTR4_9BACT|nr:TRAP transporter substrate-binding protein [Fundidesulfovibrio magnetotacticus]GFK95853.1 Solute-binding protein [Fundidesulfovibrio magnetotacticus]